MKIVGITGGIGAGKTTVSNVFSHLGIPVFNADVAAKQCVYEPKVRTEIINLLGEESFLNQQYNTAFVASKVFNNKQLLSGLNAIIHPAVQAFFSGWTQKQSAPYILKEAAILVETGGYKFLDALIVVSAPEQQRIQRVVSRNQVDEETVKQRIKNQLADSERIKYATYVVDNSNNTPILEQILGIHQQLLEL